MERILLATDYPNLTELKIYHFQGNDLYYLIRGSFGSSYPGLSLRDLPFTTFSSPILTHLCINVDNFDDCLYLLDGRLRQLTTFYVTVYTVDSSSEILHYMGMSDLFEEYDKISSLFRRMSNLEKLTLNISIRRRNRVIDGTDVQHDIFDFMPQLYSFTFCICTYVEMVDLSHKLTSEDIQQTLTDIGQQHAVSMVSYVNLGNKYPNTVFSYVTYLLVRDTVPFEHEFFMRIARSFPSLKHLRIFNMKSQTLNSRMTFSSDNSQLYSIIEYPHLTILD
ncbi:unnamed protein product, partial [Rotaria sordida]